MTPRELGAKERERRKVMHEMTQKQRGKGSAIVGKLSRYNWRSRAVRHLLSLWDVPPTDRDLLHCGKREA